QGHLRPGQRLPPQREHRTELGGRPMLGFHNREVTTVDASPEAVFAIVGDLSRHVELSGSGEVKALRQVGDGAVRVGTTFEAGEEIRVMGRTTKMIASSEVVEFDP